MQNVRSLKQFALAGRRLRERAVACAVEPLESRTLYSHVKPVSFSVDGQGDLFTVNCQTGATKFVAVARQAGLRHAPALLLTGLAFSPARVLYGIDAQSDLYLVNSHNGKAKLIGPAGGSIRSIAFGPDGTLYGVGDSLYTINLASGAAALVGPTNPPIGSVEAITFDPFGNLYGTTTNDDLVVIQTGTGIASVINTLGFHDVEGLSFEPDGVLTGLTNAGQQIIDINPLNGAGTLAATFGNRHVHGIVGGASSPTSPSGSRRSVYVTNSKGTLISSGAAVNATTKKNGTLFTDATPHVFVVHNGLSVAVGIGQLKFVHSSSQIVRPVTITGDGASEFSIPAQPGRIIPAGGTETFEITATPAAAPAQTATVGIVSGLPSLRSDIMFNIEALLA